MSVLLGPAYVVTISVSPLDEPRVVEVLATLDVQWFRTTGELVDRHGRYPLVSLRIDTDRARSKTVIKQLRALADAGVRVRYDFAENHR